MKECTTHSGVKNAFISCDARQERRRTWVSLISFITQAGTPASSVISFFFLFCFVRPTGSLLAAVSDTSESLRGCGNRFVLFVAFVLGFASTWLYVYATWRYIIFNEKTSDLKRSHNEIETTFYYGIHT